MKKDKKKKVKNKTKKNKEFIKKYWFIILIFVASLLRFLFTYKLPSFYLYKMNYDDGLMIDNLVSIFTGRYLGVYGHKTLVKGTVFSFLLVLIKIYRISNSSTFTLLYIVACIYFIYSLKNIIKDRRYLIIIYIVLLFNPVTYSQDLFQRLYRNSISITELLFFLGAAISVLFSNTNKKSNILKYVFLGITLSIMFLTREDNIWTYPVILFIIVYNFFRNKNIKTLFINLIPILVLTLSLNLISYVNYKHYGIYTYNELQKSEFHDTYKKILQIKDDEKIEKVAIPKSTFYKLSEKVESFNLSKEEIDKYYRQLGVKDGEIYNGNIVWYFRSIMYSKNKFKTGKDSEKYYKKLGEEIDKLFDEGVLEKEFIMPSVFMDVPTKKEIIKLPKNVLKTVKYTSTYKNIKTMTDTSKYKYDKFAQAYYFDYPDYHHTVNIVKKNPLKYEIIRLIYKYFTIILSVLSIVIYLKNIRKFDEISIISHILIVCYCLIIGGVAYTHTTSFHAIRPLYLGNVYILQNIFLLLNLYRLKRNH